MTRLLTDAQVCEQFGIPSKWTLRTMRGNGLIAVRLGKSYLYDEVDVIAFIESAKVCRALTPAPDCTGKPGAESTTSDGTSVASRGFVRQARRISDSLKKPLPRSSAQVIDWPALAVRSE
jgi:hypothetical protein